PPAPVARPAVWTGFRRCRRIWSGTAWLLCPGSQDGGASQSIATRGGTNMLTSMTRRHLAVAAVGSLLVVGLAACGGDDGAGGSEDPIRIGASLPLTGEFSQPGQAALEGYEIWRDLVNEKGGLLGRPVELVIKDDASNQNTIVADYNALISQDRVDLLLGTFSSLLNLPASAVAERNQMLYV